ncbi:MAG: hypothetical protein C4530_15385 [Desulfobacteraceae bacterium]|nr:MAG: hypothetical protein C4530_15385 [Desulfobacteraceae bacterium]
MKGLQCLLQAPPRYRHSFQNCGLRLFAGDRSAAPGNRPPWSAGLWNNYCSNWKSEAVPLNGADLTEAAEPSIGRMEAA